jgi:hypothetical protein
MITARGYNCPIIFRGEQLLHTCSEYFKENISGMGYNVGKSLMMHGTKLLFVTVSRLLVSYDLENNYERKELGTYIEDFAVVEKDVVTLDQKGSVKYLDKDIKTQIPKEDNEVFTHIKYGCRTIVTVSYKRGEGLGESIFHLMNPSTLRILDKCETGKDGKGVLIRFHYSRLQYVQPQKGELHCFDSCTKIHQRHALQQIKDNSSHYWSRSEEPRR